MATLMYLETFLSYYYFLFLAIVNDPNDLNIRSKKRGQLEVLRQKSIPNRDSVNLMGTPSDSFRTLAEASLWERH